MKLKKYGLKIDTIKDSDYIFGYSPIPYEEINPSGDWESALPSREEQNLGLFETYACVSFTILNCLETLIKKQYGEEKNYSDRFLASISGTKNGGNSPIIVADFLRRMGVVPQDLLPFTTDIKSFEEFYSPISQEIKDIAKEFLNEFEFKFELVPDDKEEIKKALKCSPLLVSVCAWFQNGEKYYKPDGMTDNHATTLISLKEGEYQRIFDSYADGEGDPFIKDYEWKAPHMIILRFWIKKKQALSDNLSDKNLSDIKRTPNWFLEIMANLWAFIKDIVSLRLKDKDIEN